MSHQFVDSIIHGAQSVIHTSGDILAAIAAIKAAAGIDKEVNTLDGFMDSLPDWLGTAAKVITAAASVLADDDPRVLKHPDGTLDYTGSITGLFTTPTTLDAQGKLGPDMYKTISQNLAFMKVPASYTSLDGTIRDTAEDIGIQAFANAPLASGVSTPFTTLPINIASKDGSMTVQGKHAYYVVPTQSNNEQNMWHSAVCLKTTTTQAFREAYMKKTCNQIMMKSKSEILQSADKDAWLVNLDVTWSSQVFGSTVYDNFNNIYQSAYGQGSITYYSSEGAVWHLKVQALKGETPAQIRAQVSSTAKMAMTGNSGRSSLSGSQNAVVILTEDDVQPPDVEVTGSILVLLHG